MNIYSDTELAQILWEYLRLEHPLRKADVIIGLGSHDLQTAEWSARLYGEGWAPRIVFCGGRGRLTENLIGNEADRFAEIAIQNGVPSHAILRDTASQNTGENIKNTYDLLRDHPPSRIILVTKPYMLRRAYATFMKQWPAQPVPELMCSAVDVPISDYGKNFELLTQTIEIMVGDLQRIREYPKRGFQIEQDILPEVWAAYEELVQRGYTQHLLPDV